MRCRTVALPADQAFSFGRACSDQKLRNVGTAETRDGLLFLRGKESILGLPNGTRACAPVPHTARHSIPDRGYPNSCRSPRPSRKHEARTLQLALR
jgi:hypothetical protein